MTDPMPKDQVATTPPPADQQQSSAENGIKWTREHWLAFWANIASFLNVGFAAVAFLILVRTLWITQESLAAAQRSVVEAHEQVVHARRQADAAENQLIASTRAQLKILDFTRFNNARIGSEIPDVGLVVWFDFSVSYRNFGTSPAEDIFFNSHIFVVGAGPSPKRTCEEDRRRAQSLPTDIVFPQEKGGTWFGTQVLFSDLQKQASEVRAVQPLSPIYLGAIGCLVYRSGSQGKLYVTGFNADLHAANPQLRRQRSYVPLYDIVSALADSRPTKAGTEVRMEVKVHDAWAD